MPLRYLAHVVLLPVLLAGAVIAANRHWYSGPLVETGDEAAYALQVERAKRFGELVGPYSRFDFNHPGPVASYYYAATEPMLAALPSPMGRHHVAQLLLNMAFLVMALHAVYVLSPRKTDTLLVAAALLFVLARSHLDPDFFSKTWHHISSSSRRSRSSPPWPAYRSGGPLLRCRSSCRCGSRA